jgi:CubicO group peptidase (beta-lactamase class C family)
MTVRTIFVALSVIGAVTWNGLLLAQTANSQDAAPANAKIRQTVERFVGDHEIAGAVTLVATPNRIVHLDAVGQANVATNQSMRPDAIFWIASMTKPITAATILMLQDEGKLSVDDPVAKHIPEFGKLTTADGKPARVTIRHLLTHTSGLSEISSEQARGCETLSDVIPLYVAKAVQFEPGSKWVYCQSGINSAGRIVEIVSGQSFVEFLNRRLFTPLGMRDTTFYLSPDQLARLATSYRRTDQGALEPASIMLLFGKSATSRDRFPAANGGLFSTATDYARFCQMLLDNGEAEGKRFLSPASIRLMSTIQTDRLQTGFTLGNGWGIGCCVVREPQGITAMLSPGTFGHGGAYGTQAWIDPQAKRIYILMVQRANFPNSDASPVRKAFQETAAAEFAP